MIGLLENYELSWVHFSPCSSIILKSIHQISIVFLGLPLQTWSLQHQRLKQFRAFCRAHTPIIIYKAFANHRPPMGQVFLGLDQSIGQVRMFRLIVHVMSDERLQRNTDHLSYYAATK